MAEQKYIPRLKYQYDTEIVSKLGKDLEIDNSQFDNLYTYLSN